MTSTWETLWPFQRQESQFGAIEASAWQERSYRRCPVSHSIGGVTAHLKHPQGLSTHGLLWDLSRTGACVLLHQNTSFERDDELLLRLSPSLGVDVVEVPARVCWSDASNARMYLGLFFHRGELPENTFLEFIIRSC